MKKAIVDHLFSRIHDRIVNMSEKDFNEMVKKHSIRVDNLLMHLDLGEAIKTDKNGVSLSVRISDQEIFH